MKYSIVCLMLTASVSGCATRGANYEPLVDMRGHTPQQYANDVSECQSYARQRSGASDGAVAGAVVGGLLGAVIAPRGYRNESAGQMAIIGAAGGALGANGNQEMITKRCMAGRGYNVLN